MMLKKIETYFLELVQGKRKGPMARVAKTFLRFLSWFYKLIISCRNWAFDHGCFKQYHAPVPVVMSIGNIVVGGTGKTPVTLMIAQEFYEEFLIAILSRGYRSKAERLPSPVVLSNGKGPMHAACYCGDEPFLLSQNLPKAHVIVGKNRHLSSKMAVKAGAQLILLDDGMQHRYVARDYEIVVMDALDPFGQGFYLPRGFLRESISSLSRADLIILNHVYDKDRFFTIKDEISKFTRAPLVGTRMEVADILDLQGRVISDMKGKRVGVFCAIARPEYFCRTVTQVGAEIVDTKFIPDHRSFTNEELLHFCERAKNHGAEWILCTEKDVVKLDKTALGELNIAWFKMRLTIVEGKSYWDHFTQKTKQALRRRM